MKTFMWQQCVEVNFCKTRNSGESGSQGWSCQSLEFLADYWEGGNMTAKSPARLPSLSSVHFSSISQYFY